MKMLPTAGQTKVKPHGGTGGGAASLFRTARKMVVAVVGLSVLGFGLGLIVLPGPAVLVVPLGLAILATEFLWASRLLRQVKARLRQMLGKPSQPDCAEARR